MTTYRLTKADRDLIGYCEIHCQTERALFHSKQVNRILELLGNPNKFSEGFYSFQQNMEDACKEIREKYAPCEHCHDTGMKVVTDQHGVQWKENCNCNGDNGR